MRHKPKRAQPSAREERGQPGRRPLWLRLLLRLVLGGLLLLLLGVVGVVGIFTYYGRDADLKQISSLHEYQPPLVTRLFDRTGVMVGEIALERRTVVPYHRIPKLMIKAVVAAEDAAFFQHQGLNYLGMLRAFLANLRAGRFAQGGSSITQQVVKTVFLCKRTQYHAPEPCERTLRRKVQEVLLARRLETELNKEEIVYLYLNQIYYGHGRYGVQEASRFFFGKDVNQLKVGEMALLAGLPQSPERLSPFKHPRRAKQRQTYVLGRMAKLGIISEAEARRLVEAPIQVVRSKRPFLTEAAEFTDLVRAQLAQTFGEKKLSSLGLQVRTTLEVKLQLAAREAVQWGLAAIDARQGFRRRVTNLKGKRLEQTLERLRRRQPVIKEGMRYQAVVLRVDDAADELEVDLGSRKGRVVLHDDERYNPQHHAASKRFASGDLLRLIVQGEELRYDGGPQAALVALDPRTGEVLALVGGYDYQPGSYNRATQAVRQPGSAFKPFVYAAALDSGQFTAASMIVDEAVKFGSWEPKNYEGEFRGPVTLRQALAHSINTVTAKVLNAVKVDPVRQLAREMGITTPLGEDLSLALGTSEVRPLDLAAAYAAIANGGKRVEPQLIQRIGNQPLRRPEPRQVLRPEVAFVLTSMMQSVVQEGTARRALRLGRQVAGKTGTTNEQKDAWFAGFTPQLVTVVWVGFDEPRSLGRHETGGQAALPIWLRFMQRALRGQQKLPFSQPPGVVKQRINPATGEVAGAEAMEAIEEYFIQGTEPKVPEAPTDGGPASMPSIPPLPGAGSIQLRPGLP